MSAFLDVLAWIGSCVAVHHHSARLRMVGGCYDSPDAGAIVRDYDAAHDLAAEGARLAGRAVKNRSVLAPWLHQARLLHRQCGCQPIHEES